MLPIRKRLLVLCAQCVGLLLLVTSCGPAAKKESKHQERSKNVKQKIVEVGESDMFRFRCGSIGSPSKLFFLSVDESGNCQYRYAWESSHGGTDAPKGEQNFRVVPDVVQGLREMVNAVDLEWELVTPDVNDRVSDTSSLRSNVFVVVLEQQHQTVRCVGSIAESAGLAEFYSFIVSGVLDRRSDADANQIDTRLLINEVQSLTRP